MADMVCTVALDVWAIQTMVGIGVIVCCNQDAELGGVVLKHHNEVEQLW